MSESDPVRVVLYARVSTDMQAEQGKSIAAQLRATRRYATQRNWQVVKEYVDPGYSGTTMERPGLQALLTAAAHQTFDILLVHELSRLSRRLFDTFALFEKLGQHHVGFASVNDQNFDFTSPTDRLFLTFLSALNQYYVDLLKMHTRKGKLERARQGLYNSSIAPYGYQHTGDADTPPQIVETEAPAVRQLFARYATGKYSYQDSAAWLTDAGYRTRAGKHFSKDTIADMIRNPFYKGYVRYSQGQHAQDAAQLFPGQHDALIDEDVWERCRQIREQRRSAPRTYQPSYRVYLLNGLINCDVCGRALRAQGTATTSYYREASKMRGFTDCSSSGRGARMEYVDAQIGALVRHLKLPETWQAELRTMLAEEEEQETLRHRRSRLVQERKRLKRMKIRGEFEADPEVYTTEQARIKRQLAALPLAGDLDALQGAAEMLVELAAIWDDSELVERRDLLRLALQKVELDVPQARVVAIHPYPLFVPLFRRIELLREVDFGRFVPVWTPEVAQTLQKIRYLPPLQALPTPDTAPDWPLVTALPSQLQGARITPQLSKWLKEQRQAGAPRGPIVARPHPQLPPLQVDSRKWPEVQLQRVTELAELAPESVYFLWTPFLLQRSGRAVQLVTQLHQLLAPGGTWSLVELLPATMPAHWLYRYFPATWQNECQHTLDTAHLYNLLLKTGFDVDLKRTTFYQAVSLDVAWQVAQQRARSPQLSNLPDTLYQEQLAALADERQTRGGDALVPSEFCLAQITARRGHAS